MGWDNDGRYYSRSRRENGRVVREYIGGGQVGELVARFDAVEREKRLTDREVARAEREKVVELDVLLYELDKLADLLVQAAMLAAGYHQHKRGNWRKRRANQHQSD